MELSRILWQSLTFPANFGGETFATSQPLNLFAVDITFRCPNVEQKSPDRVTLYDFARKTHRSETITKASRKSFCLLNAFPSHKIHKKVFAL